MTCEIGSYQNIIAAIIATVAAVVYNYHKHQHDKSIFSRDLFVTLNERYESVRGGLEKILDWETDTRMKNDLFPHENPDLETILDDTLHGEFVGTQGLLQPMYKYLTLCSEQYYWYQKGNVEEDVWACWRQAMLEWFEWSETFQQIILKERKLKVVYYSPKFLSIFPVVEDIRPAHASLDD